MDQQPIVTFTSAKEEAKHWAKVAFEYKQKYQELKEDTEEFQLHSRELEAELEAQLENSEQQNKELRSNLSRVQMECDGLREKLENVQNESNRTISDLQNELDETKSRKDELVRYVRDLEQTNDDLERTKRATVVSLEDFELKLNQAIERNAFLENELDDKQSLVVSVQRLKDEARDLRQELQIRDRQGSPLTEPDNDRYCEKLLPLIDSNKLTVETETQTIVGSPAKCTNGQLLMSSSPLTPSARISALNIVGELLRKVGALESKLASCRNFVKDSPRSYQIKSSPHNSPR